MAKIHDILTYPDPRLRRPARPVTEFDDRLKALADDMLATMYASDGLGLAAPQINVPLRLVVVDFGGEEQAQPEVLVNPAYRVLPESGRISMEEGCLSVPNIRVEIQRFARIEFRYLDLDGNEHTEIPEDLRCLCLQHEIDHLNGRLLVDYLSKMQRNRYRRELQKAPMPAKERTADMQMVAAQAPWAVAETDGANALKPVGKI